MLIEKLKNFLCNNKYLLGIILVYFLLRLINLSLLPIFNDESIYLDWGWREIHSPNVLFYSLYDAKQPLLMWIFGIFESYSKDPLIAGRLVSVLCGLASLLGIYAVGKTIWNKKSALYSALLYSLSPLFLFYDRQALMESAIGTIGIWSLFFLIKLSKKPFVQYAFLLGLVLGSGYFIKSSALLFLIASIVLFFLILFHNKQKSPLILASIVTYMTVFLVLIPLFIQQQFWDSLPTNARFSLTFSDYLQFPLSIWWNNISAFFQTSFFFLTPLVFATSLVGIVKVLKTPTKEELLLFLWLFLTIGGQILVTRNTSLRYIVSFLPLLLLFASVTISTLSPKLQSVGLAIFASIPLGICLWQLFQPANYIVTMSKFTPLAPVEYVIGQTSGYGIPEVKQYIDNHAPTSHTAIGIAENTGNPESALQMYYQQSKTVTVFYMDSKIFGDVVDQYDCLDPGYPFYFVSRDEQQAGLNKFFIKVKTFRNPYSSNTWGVYTLKPNCKGRIAKLTMEKD